MKRFIISTIAVLALAVGVVGFLHPTTALAETAKDAVCSGVGAVSGTTGCSTPTGSSSVNDIVATVVNVMSVLVGVTAVIMIIVGGFRYVTSAGDSGKTSGAKNTIIFALVGLVIVALAQTIVRFVLSKTT